MLLGTAAPLGQALAKPETAAPLAPPVDRARDMTERSPRELVVKPELEATFWIEKQVLDFSGIYPGQTATRTLAVLIGHAGSGPVACRIQGGGGSPVRLSVVGAPELNRRSSVGVRAVAPESSAGQDVRGELVVELGNQSWRIPIRGRVGRPAIVAELMPMATTEEQDRPAVRSALRVHLDPEGTCPLKAACALPGLSLTPAEFRGTPDTAEVALRFVPVDYPGTLSWQSEISITGPGLEGVVVPVSLTLPPPSPKETAADAPVTAAPGPGLTWPRPNWLWWLLLALLLCLLAALARALRLSRRAACLLISALVHALVMLMLMPRAQPEKSEKGVPGTVRVRTGQALHEERISPEVPAPAKDAAEAPPATDVEKLAADEPEAAQDQSGEAAPAASEETVTHDAELTAPPETQPSAAAVRELLEETADPSRKRQEQQERAEQAAESSLAQMRTAAAAAAAESATLAVTPAASAPEAVATLADAPLAVTPEAMAPKALAQTVEAPERRKPTAPVRTAAEAAATTAVARVAIRTYQEPDHETGAASTAPSSADSSVEATEDDLSQPGQVARNAPGSLREMTAPAAAPAPKSAPGDEAPSDEAPTQWDGAAVAAASQDASAASAAPTGAALSASASTGGPVEASEDDLSQPGQVARSAPGSLREMTAPAAAPAPKSTPGAPGDGAPSDGAPAQWDGAAVAVASATGGGDASAGSATSSADGTGSTLSASTGAGRSVEASEGDLSQPGQVARSAPGSLREMTAPAAAPAPKSAPGAPGDGAPSAGGPAQWDGAAVAVASATGGGDASAGSAMTPSNVSLPSGGVGGGSAREGDLSARMGRPGRTAGRPSELASAAAEVAGRRAEGAGAAGADSGSAPEFRAGPVGAGGHGTPRDSGQLLAAAGAVGGRLVGPAAAAALASAPSLPKPSVAPGEGGGAAVAPRAPGRAGKAAAKTRGSPGGGASDQPVGFGGVGPALSKGAAAGERPAGRGLAVAGAVAAVTAGSPAGSGLPPVARVPVTPGQLAGAGVLRPSAARGGGKAGGAEGRDGDADESPLPQRLVRRSSTPPGEQRPETSLALAVTPASGAAVTPETDGSTAVLSGTGGGGREGRSEQWRRTFPLVKYSGDWDCDKTAMLNLAHHFENRTDSLFPFDSRTVDLDHPELDRAPFLFVTGHRDFALKGQEATRLREYLEQGGAMWINDSTDVADHTFDKAVRRELKKTLPSAVWRRIPMDHPIFKAPYNLSGGFLGYRVPPGDKYRTEYLEGIWLAGRLAVVYTRNDYGDGLEINVKAAPLMTSLSDLSPGQMQEASVEMGMNIVSHFLANGDVDKIPRLEQPGYLMQDDRAAAAEKWAGAPAAPLPILAPPTAWSAPAEWGEKVLDTKVEGRPGPRPALSLTFAAGDRTFRAWHHQGIAGREVDLAVGEGGAILIDVVSHLAGGARISIAFALRAGHGFIETEEAFIRPGTTANIAFDLSASTFKTATSNWQNTEAIPAGARAERIYILVHPQQGDGRVDVLNARFAQPPGQ